MTNSKTYQQQGNILVVDDTLVSLRALLAILRKQGFETRGAPDGPTALMLIEAELPDLIMLDINMPEMNGYQLCRRLKSQATTCDIPVIFISGLAEMVDKVKGFAVGGVDFISKPFQTDEVIARVKTHLTLRNLQQTLQRQNTQLQQEIQERNRVERDLKQAHDELEQRVVERTIELSEANARLKEEIAERRRSEAAVRESEEHFRKIFEDSPLGMSVVASDYHLIQVNTMLCHMLGYTAAELTNLTFLDYTHPDDVDEDLQLARQLFDGAISFYKIEKRYIRKDKQILWINLTVTMIRDGDGAPLYALGMAEDVSERKHAEASLRQSTERLRILHEIDMGILAARSPEEIAEAALRHLRLLLSYDRAAVAIYNEAFTESITIAVDTNLNTQLGKGTRWPLAQIQDQIDQLRQGQVTFQDNPFLLGQPGQIAYQEGLRSAVFIPLIAQDTLIGSLSLSLKNRQVWTAEVEEIAREIAAQLAIAIQQARLFEAEAQRRREAETLRNATAALTSALDLGQVLDNIMTQLKLVVPYDSSALFLQEGIHLQVVAGRGFTEPEHIVGQLYPLEQDTFFAEMQQHGQPIILTDAQIDSHFLKWGESGHIHGWMGIPLLTGGEVIGHLTLDNRQIGAYGETEAKLAQGFANQAAIAIKNAQLLEAERQQRGIAETLGNVAGVINSSLQLNEVLDKVLVELEMIVPYDSASIMLLENDQLRIVAGQGFANVEALMAVSLPLAELPLAQKVIAQQQPLVVPDTTQEPLFNPAARGTTNLRCLIAIPLIQRDNVVGLLSLDSLTPNRYTIQDADIAFRFAHQATIAIENARLYARVQHYTVELEQRVIDRTRELSVLYDVTAAASEALDLQTTLEQSLERVLAAMESNAGLIHLLNESQQVLNLVVAQGFLPELESQLATVSLDSELARWLYEYDEPLLITDITSDPRLADLSYHGQPQTYVGLPMRARGKMMGVLSIIRETAQPQFNIEELTLLSSIADQVGVVVESARLRQQAERTAVLEERARLARELHDSVTQLLYSINLFAKSGRNAYEADNMAEVMNCLLELGDSAQQALKEMRLLVYELRPPVLKRDGLVGALQHRLDAVEGRAGITAQLLTNQMVPLPARLEQDLYHIALEALNNSLKHAQASSVTISVETGQDYTRLEVADNGCGFDPEQAVDSGGLGLISMRQRAERIGGLLNIQAQAGQGTTIRVRVENLL